MTDAWRCPHCGAPMIMDDRASSAFITYVCCGTKVPRTVDTPLKEERTMVGGGRQLSMRREEWYGDV